MIGQLYLASSLLIGLGDKFSPCDSSIKPEHSDAFFVDSDPVLENDTLKKVPKIYVQEREVLGNIVVSHFYVGKRGKKILHGRYEVVSHSYSPGKIRESGNYSHNKREGRWTKWYVTGQTEDESEYKNGFLEGVNTSYWPNGIIFEKQKITQGKFDCKDGFAQVYHENGRLKLDFAVRNGLIVKNDLFDTLGLPTKLKITEAK